MQTLQQCEIGLEETSLQFLIANLCDEDGLVNFKSFCADLVIELVIDFKNSIVTKWHLGRAVEDRKKRYFV